MTEKSGGFLRRLFRRANQQSAPAQSEVPTEATVRPTPEPEEPLKKDVAQPALEKTENQKKAEELLRQLREKQGKKGLVMIVDWHTDDVQHLVGEEGFGARQRVNPGYVISTYNTAREAVEVYSAFRKADQEDNTVVIVMGGSLEVVDTLGRRIRGSEVAKQINDLSGSNGWTKPYFVGDSAEKAPNQALQNEAQNNYLGGINLGQLLINQKDIINGIEATFK